MRIRILFVLAVLALVASAGGASASQSDQPQKLPIQELFDKALPAKGNEYIKLRGELIERKNAVSFLKARMSDKDWKTAILAEAMLARITEPQRYPRYEQILRHAADERFLSMSLRPPFPVGELNKELEDKNKRRLLPFFVELAIKDSVAYLDYPSLGYSEEFLEKYNRKYYDRERYAILVLSDPNNRIEDIAKLPLEKHEELCRILEKRQRDKAGRALFRRYATTCLRLFTNQVAQAALVELLSCDDDPEIRRYAVEGMKDPNAAGHLRAALQDSHPMVREAAALALGKLVDAESVDALIATLKDKNPVVREGAAIALGQIGDPNAVEPLVDLLKTHYEKAIAVALGKIDLEALLALLQDEDSIVNVCQVVALALVELADARTVSNLLAALHDKDRLVRDFAAEALGKIGDPRAVGPLINAIQRDAHPDVRSSAAKALGEIGDPEAVEALIIGLRDQSRHVRGNAARALRKIGDSRALEALEKAAAHDKDTNVACTARLAIREIKKKNRSKKPEN